MALGDVPVDTDVEERHGEVDDAVEHDWACPRRFVLHCRAEAEKADHAQDEREDVEREAEFLQDTVSIW